MRKNRYPAQKAHITYQPESTPDYPYNVQIWQNLFETKIWFYAGKGRFCKTLEEAMKYAEENHVEDMTFANVELN